MRLLGAAVATVLASALAACSGPALHDAPAEESEPEVLRVTDLPPLPADWWNPGLIVSDANFFDADAMTVGEITAFLEAQVPRCATWRERTDRAQDPGPPYICLKDRVWRVDRLDVVGDDGSRYCEPVPARARATSAEVIALIASACGISPKALLVTLEKEQGLVTDDWPWQSQFDAAMGYACYDSAPCVDAYSGFVGQVYHAARSYQLYVQRPERFNFQPFEENAILYAPGCAAAPVFIENAATAALYDYTPYQPNAEILAGGRAEECNAFGNYNFWRLWFFWFGDPLADDPSTAREWPGRTQREL